MYRFKEVDKCQQDKPKVINTHTGDNQITQNWGQRNDLEINQSERIRYLQENIVQLTADFSPEIMKPRWKQRKTFQLQGEVTPQFFTERKTLQEQRHSQMKRNQENSSQAVC